MGDLESCGQRGRSQQVDIRRWPDEGAIEAVRAEGRKAGLEEALKLAREELEWRARAVGIESCWGVKAVIEALEGALKEFGQ